MNSTKALVVAVKDYFGMLPGHGLLEFKKEYVQLTPRDRIELAQGLRKNGYPYIELQVGK